MPTDNLDQPKPASPELSAAEQAFLTRVNKRMVERITNLTQYQARHVYIATPPNTDLRIEILVAEAAALLANAGIIVARLPEGVRRLPSILAQSMVEQTMTEVKKLGSAVQDGELELGPARTVDTSHLAGYHKKPNGEPCAYLALGACEKCGQVNIK